MKKDKITLADLKIKSVVTSLDAEQMKNVKGGLVAQMRYKFKTRWTSIDTRLGSPDPMAGGPNGG